jgi:hypothetical protein
MSLDKLLCNKLSYNLNIFPKNFTTCEDIIQGDSYSFINILTSGRFRSHKALNNKILSHIGFFKCHSSLNYSTLRPMYNKCHECHTHNRSKQCCQCCHREMIGITYKVRFSFILTTMPDTLFQRNIFSFICSF